MRLLDLAGDTTLVRPADATAYAAGDEISNNSTAGSVARVKFDLTGFQFARPRQLRIAAVPASGNFVVTNAAFEALLFKTDDVPAAVGDNVTHPIAADTAIKHVGRFLPVAGGWRDQLGAAASGTSALQSVSHALGGLVTDAVQFKNRETESLTLVLRALAAWNPGNVANTFTFRLEVEVGD